jgi:hypothetical protein
MCLLDDAGQYALCIVLQMWQQAKASADVANSWWIIISFFKVHTIEIALVQKVCQQGACKGGQLFSVSWMMPGSTRSA